MSKAIFGFLLILIILTGCNSNQPSEPPTEDEHANVHSIIGQWSVIEIAGPICDLGPCVVPGTAFWQFNEDYTYQIGTPDSIYFDGTFSFETDTLNCASDNRNEILSLTPFGKFDYEIQQNDTLIMTTCPDAFATYVTVRRP